jgi:hypothetical protein
MAGIIIICFSGLFRIQNWISKIQVQAIIFAFVPDLLTVPVFVLQDVREI